MPNELDRLLRLMANSLSQSELPICQLLAAALEESVSQIHTKANQKSEIIPLKFDGIEQPLIHTHMDLYQAILQSSDDLSAPPRVWQNPVDIASHIAVCEIIGPMAD